MVSAMREGERGVFQNERERREAADERKTARQALRPHSCRGGMEREGKGK